MIDYEKFHNYLKDVVQYYQEKKTLKGFSELAKKHHCRGITRELFFKFGLDNVIEPEKLDRNVSNNIRSILAKGENGVNPMKEEQKTDEGICTFKEVGAWDDLLSKEEVIIYSENPDPDLLPKLRRGMLVYIVTKYNEWCLDWFVEARWNATKNKVTFICVCDHYTDCKIYPCTPYTRSSSDHIEKNDKFSGAWKENLVVFQKWSDKTIKEVTDYCKINGVYK